MLFRSSELIKKCYFIRSSELIKNVISEVEGYMLKTPLGCNVKKHQTIGIIKKCYFQAYEAVVLIFLSHKILKQGSTL